MRYYTTGTLSPNIQVTPEGYLLCPGTAIARTGVLEYAPEEVGIEAGPDGIVTIHRAEEQVFAPEAMASFEGKPVTLEHPDEDVNPSSWRELAVGIAQNVRRGEGGQADLLLADLLITDKSAIEEVRKGLRELSCGYDAHYEELGPGTGRQTGIVGNHIALVEAGRCGPRCKIKDHQLTVRSNMPDALKKKPGWWDRLWGNPKVRKALHDAAAEEAAKDEAAGQTPAPAENASPTTDDGDKLDQIIVLLNTLIERLGAKPAGDQETPAGDEETPTGDEDDPDDEDKPTGDDDPKEDPAKTSDARRKTADSALVASAKLVAPGLAFRTTDSACTVKRMALRDAAADPQVRRVVDACLRGASLDKADCLTLDAAFTAVAEIARSRANAKTRDALLAAKTADATGSRFMTPAQINEQSRKYRDSLAAK